MVVLRDVCLCVLRVCVRACARARVGFGKVQNKPEVKADKELGKWGLVATDASIFICAYVRD